MHQLDFPAVSVLLRGARRDFRHCWRRLLVADLAFKLLAIAVLGPLAGAALRAGIALAGEPVLADQDILFFALRPVGLLVLTVAAAVTVALVALEQASLMAIAASVHLGTRATAAGALRWTAVRALPVLALSWRLVARALLLAAPFLAGIALVYLGLLREHDINFYLQERPPVFLVAVGLAALLVLGLAWVLLPRIVGWSLALPLVLFERVLPRHAMAESERRIAAAHGTAARVLVAWATGALLLALGLQALVFALGRLLAPSGTGQLRLVLALMLGVAALWTIVNLLVGWLNASAFALLLVRLFRELGGEPGDLDELATRAQLAGGGLRISWRAALVGLAVLALATGGAGAYLLLSVRADGEVVVIAHRGAAASAPENTLAAVEEALEQGADFVEIDVQETADGEIAVAHDSDFMKVAGVPTKVWEATWEDLQHIDVGAWFGPGFAGQRVPHLRDVLGRARGRGRVTIELKYYGHDERLEQRVVELVESLGAVDDVILMSLEVEGVRKLRALRPEWTVGLLASRAIGDLASIDVDFLAVHVSLATRSFVRRAQARGKKVYVWTVDDPVRMFQALNLGVDGIITNRPDLAREVLNRRAGLSGVERLLVGLAFHFGAAAPDPPAADDGA